MRLTCVGGGPAGLYFALLMKLRHPQHEVTVLERNTADATHGWGLTLGRDVLDTLVDRDPASAEAIELSCVHWTRQVVRFGGEQTYSDNYSVYNVARQVLTDTLASRARDAGVRITYGVEVARAADLPSSDLIVAADGAQSRVRSSAGEFGTSVHEGRNKYIWLGCTAPLDMFNYIFEATAHGWIWAYAYQFDAHTSTVIVECSTTTWTGLGLDAMSAAEGVALLSELFKEQLDGHRLIAQLPDGSTATWLSFRTVTNEHWHRGNVALVGDSAHTAHYSLGQGTKMALEDAIALADNLQRHSKIEAALTGYEAQRKRELARPLSEARCSAEWFENLPRYADLNPRQFATLLESRWSPLVRVLPPQVSYHLRQASERFTVLHGIRARVGPALKLAYGPRKPGKAMSA